MAFASLGYPDRGTFPDSLAQARDDRLPSWVTLAEAPDHFPTVEDSYETPTADDELVSALRAALASVPDLQEAYLVSRRRSVDGRERNEELGVVARAGGRWRSRKRVAALSEAIKPFYPPPVGTSSLGWVHLGNVPVPEEAKAVGIRLGGHS